MHCILAHIRFHLHVTADCDLSSAPQTIKADSSHQNAWFHNVEVYQDQRSLVLSRLYQISPSACRRRLCHIPCKRCALPSECQRCRWSGTARNHQGAWICPLGRRNGSCPSWSSWSSCRCRQLHLGASACQWPRLQWHPMLSITVSLLDHVRTPVNTTGMVSILMARKEGDCFSWQKRESNGWLSINIERLNTH